MAILGLVELGVRVFLPEIRPIGTEKTLIDDMLFNGRGGLAQNASGLNNGALVQTNDQRTIKYEKPYNAEFPSLLFIGDSVTMGLGVEPDSSFAGRLSAQLDSTNVLNTALIGYNGTDYKAVVDSFLSVKSPLKQGRKQIEEVLVFWCLNDIYRDVPLSTIPGALTRKVGAGILPFIRRHFRLYQFLKNGFFDRARSYYEHDAFYYAPVGSYYQFALKKLTEIQHICEEQEVGLQVVLLPYEYQLRRHLPIDSLNVPQEIFKKDLHALGIPVVDGLDFMRSQAGDSKKFFLYGDGIHFSDSGHRAFTEYMRGEVLLGTKRVRVF